MKNGVVVHKATAINATHQIKNATEQWGPYGSTWGLRKTQFDFQLMQLTGMALYSAEFYYPDGSFEISNAISVLVGKSKYPDSDFAKKIETDTVTKALSKLGFNADVFMGQWDDEDYVKNRHLEAELEAADNKEQFMKEKFTEIKNNVEKELQTFKKLPNIATLNNFAAKLKASTAKRLSDYNFNPQRFDDKIEAARQVRENEINGVQPQQ